MQSTNARLQFELLCRNRERGPPETCPCARCNWQRRISRSSTRIPRSIRHYFCPLETRLLPKSIQTQVPAGTWTVGLGLGRRGEGKKPLPLRFTWRSTFFSYSANRWLYSPRPFYEIMAQQSFSFISFFCQTSVNGLDTSDGGSFSSSDMAWIWNTPVWIMRNECLLNFVSSLLLKTLLPPRQLHSIIAQGCL